MYKVYDLHKHLHIHLRKTHLKQEEFHGNIMLMGRDEKPKLLFFLREK